MIIIVDGLNKDRYSNLLDEMYALRARVFGDRLGWDVEITDGKEIDQFDALDPAYVIGVNDEGRVVSCVRALQTTGPHMLSDVFSDILDGEAPLRSATLWESTRFCVDTEILDRGESRDSVSYATCELMVGSLEYAKNSGISDIVTVIDPVMNRVLKRSGCAPYDYVGSTKPMGKVRAMAALLDCSDERIESVRAFARIEGDVFVTEEKAMQLADPVSQTEPTNVPNLFEQAFGLETARTPASSGAHTASLESYCLDQIRNATSKQDMDAARALAIRLHRAGMINQIDKVLSVCH